MQKTGSGARLIIVCGLPGSGKTTHARALESQLGAVRFSADDWINALALDLRDEAKREKIEALQWKFAQDLLTRGISIIIEWGTWGRSERDALRVRARELGAGVELHYLAAPVEVLLDRIRHRALEDPPVERDEFLRWVDVFQVPTPEEMALFDNPVRLEA